MMMMMMMVSMDMHCRNKKGADTESQTFQML